MRSLFDATPFTPGFSYQLGLGGIEDFRSLGDVLATTAAGVAEKVSATVLPDAIRLSLGKLRAQLAREVLGNEAPRTPAIKSGVPKVDQ